MVEKMSNLEQMVDAQIDYYKSGDFEEQYMFLLQELFDNEENEILYRIKTILAFPTNPWGLDADLYQASEHYVEATNELAKEIYDYIQGNLETFVDRYTGYYVGYYSLESCQFGEQDIPVDMFVNKYGKQYNKKMLQSALDKKGIYFDPEQAVCGCEYAYYDLSDEGIHVGLHIQLLPDELRIKIEKLKRQ